MYIHRTIKKISVVILFLLMFALIAGCASNSGPSNTTTTLTTGTTAPGSGPAYVAGDIVKNPKSTAQVAWLVISFDASTDTYEQALVYPNADGSWGYRLNSNTQKYSRTSMEKLFTEKITNKAVASIPVRASTVPATTATVSTTATVTVTATSTTGSSDAKPSIKNIVPDEGTAGNAISITDLTGTNFQSGATVTLMKGDNPNITASNVNVQSSTLISCTFSPPSDATPGSWDIVVTNPSGQYGIYSNLFSIHGSANPTATTTTSSGGIGITSINPTFVATSNTYLPITVYGSNFQDSITAKLTRSGNSDIIATTISRTDTTQMRCFFTIPPLSQGTWSLVLTNTDGTTGRLEDVFDVRS
jgi:hypothetical protein